MIKAEVKYCAYCDGCERQAWEWEVGSWCDTEEEAERLALNSGGNPFEELNGELLCKDCADAERKRVEAEAARALAEYAAGR